ncbi:MAG TPA: DNA cytosine methyltransferase [Rhodothermales bacterium]
MKALDFFCGAGGLTRGMLDAGIEVVAGIDIDRELTKTYQWNNYGTQFINADIRELSMSTVAELLAATSTEETLFAACAPCRAFSTQRKSGTRTEDATLLGAFGRVIDEVRPGWILIENVPGLAKVTGFSTFRRFKNLLSTLGYRSVETVMNAKDYGVPQHRRRFVLVASCVQPLESVRTALNSRIGQEVTVREAIAHYPPIAAGEAHHTVSNHVAAALSPRNLNRIRSTPPDGGDRRGWPPALRLKCHRSAKSSYSDVYGRMWWNRYSPTLTGRCNSLSNGRFGHPEQHRAISLREAAALQSFPDDYVFFGSNTHIARQIGNAVPVRLGEYVSRAILNKA